MNYQTACVKVIQRLQTLLFLLCILSMPAFGQSSSLSNLLGDSSDEPLLMPDQAFIVEADPLQGNTLSIIWTVAEGYYLYRDKFNFELIDEASKSSGTKVTVVDLTRGKLKMDDFFGEVEVNRRFASAALELNNEGSGRPATLQVGYQGCADIGVCFPPQTKQFSVDLPANVGTPLLSSSLISTNNTSAGTDVMTNNLTAIPTPNSSSSPNVDINAAAANTPGVANASDSRPATNAMGLSRQDALAAKLGSSSLPLVLALFFGLGLLLAFTPCVFPMIPILSGLIIGQGEKVTVKKSLILSIVYVLAMALTYTVIGVIVGLSGQNIQIILQNPWVLSSFALLLGILAMSMFGFFELQMPVALQEKLNRLSNRQEGGTYAGAGVMGFLSALIVGPCVTAPLVGALIFIADTGDAVVGGLALFFLSIGMGAPLILIGASCGKFMPRAGAWMESVKAAFGVMMLALAIWMLSRFVSAQITMLLSAALAIISGVYLGALDSLANGVNGWRKLFKGTGVIALIYGVALFTGMLAGNHSLLKPLRGIGGVNNFASSAQSHAELDFTAVKSVDDLDEMIATAQSQGKTLILDFYADWCVSCIEMETFTFTDTEVMEQMSRAVLTRADVTANDKLDKALLKKFGLFGPPAILFFPPSGDELRNARVVGFMNSDDFEHHLEQVYSQTLANLSMYETAMN